MAMGFESLEQTYIIRTHRIGDGILIQAWRYQSLQIKPIFANRNSYALVLPVCRKRRHNQRWNQYQGFRP